MKNGVKFLFVLFLLAISCSQELDKLQNVFVRGKWKGKSGIRWKNIKEKNGKNIIQKYPYSDIWESLFFYRNDGGNVGKNFEI